MLGFKAGLASLGALAAALAISSSAQAALTLTPDAIADGFTLTQFYSDPGATYGVLGMTNTASGDIIGAGYARGQLARFNNVDGQTPASAVLTVGAPGTPTSVATVGTTTYVNALNGGYFSVDQTTLATTPLALDDNFGAGYGLWANTSNGHLLASRYSQGIVDINPLTGHVTNVVSNGIFFDGVSVSPDGTVVYGADLNGNRIRGYNILTGLEVLNVLVPGGPDGSGVISGSAFNGFIIANVNNGTVALIDPVTSAVRTIATGGSRGDLVGPDRSTGSLMLSQYEGVFRLGIEGGTIGGPSVPEPATWMMMLIGFFGLGTILRRRARLEAA